MSYVLEFPSSESKIITEKFTKKTKKWLAKFHNQLTPKQYLRSDKSINHSSKIALDENSSSNFSLFQVSTGQVLSTVDCF